MVGVMQHRVLFDEHAIAARVGELAVAVSADLPAGAVPLMIGVLNGSFIFLADLARAVARAGVAPEIEFLSASHYGRGRAPSGAVHLEKALARDLRGMAVLLVDDILDSGHTLRLVRDHVLAREPAWLRTCVLLEKPSRRTVEIAADYVGFTVPDVWVVGYGLDAAGSGRALPYLAVAEETKD
jgi:hypoxanthine phosphoribosyltransferase